MMTVRLLRLTAEHYQAYITLDEVVTGKVLWDAVKPDKKREERICGIDLNLDHAAAATTDYQGQFRDHKIFDYPNLGEMRTGKTKWTIGNLAKDMVTWANTNKISTLVLEDLNFKQTHNSNATFNRRTVPFAHRQLNQAIQRTALRNGINIKLVAPEYTSFIGNVKYAEMYGISRHMAAAYVIARRGMDILEFLPKPVVEKLPAIIEAVTPKKQKKDGKNNRQLRTWHNRLIVWKKHTPTRDHPWLLWATLCSIYEKSGTRGGATNGRNYLPSLSRSRGHSPSVKHLTACQGEQKSCLTRSSDGMPDKNARSLDKASGSDTVAF